MNMRSRRHLVSALALAAPALAGTLLFVTAQKVQTAEGRAEQLTQAIADEKQDIRVMHAEWDYLDNPARLESLMHDDSNMVPPQNGQVLFKPVVDRARRREREEGSK